MENFILELAKVTIPGLLVLLTTYYLLRDFFKNEERKRYYEMRRETAKSLNPIKLTAYERLAMFLERIRPDSLIMRVQTGNMTSGDLHLVLLTTIREEFEHNVTQQIYVGKEDWLGTKNAKETMIQLINTCASEIPNKLPAIELAKIIIERYGELEESPIDIALNILKAEVKSFG